MMIKCLIWNIRGLNDPAKRRAIKDMVLANIVHICCLQETKMVTVDRQTIADLGAGKLDEWAFKEARGAAGGILICWDSSVWQAVDKAVGTYSILVLMEDKRSGSRWCCSCVYGPHEDEEKE
ncbi:hypothetical protein QJS10_CPB20g00065 [Acorus calamus]|uniref:Endonuclease/exonuclease/phosphatase domain-containing protein n=1 Tax=Acorus calamus TaxID=4465 RepID=A0AAV9CA60_ACOCL|nr:hypothetical protein QJS10_CPB20g00065 [Acorus calamus]